jgi:hypothetical protein
MKYLKSKIILIILALVTCGLFYLKRPNQITATVGSSLNIISTEQLKEIGPIGLLNLLKTKCCAPIIVSTISTSAWITDKDLIHLKKLTNAKESVSPVISVHSSHPCSGKQFTSTLANEAKHLILAKTKGRFPVAMCSTYDLPNN